MHTRFFLELAPGGTFEALVNADKASGYRPLTFKGFLTAADQQHLERLLIDRKNEDIDRHGWMRVFITISHALPRA